MAIGRAGFVPSREPIKDRVSNVAVGAGGQPVARGDAVTLIGGLVYAATAATNPTSPLYGVVLATYTTANRPFTFMANKCIVSGQPGRADVCWDPNQTYFVQCVTSVGQSNFGTNVMIDASAVNLSLGISGMSVDIVTSASTNELFKIVGFGPYDSYLNGLPYQQVYAAGGTNNGVEVRPNYHFLNKSTSNTGT